MAKEQSATPPAEIAARQRWMAVLARAAASELEDARTRLAGDVDYAALRPAETGLAMVRGRAGGTGNRFNLGEVTLTRCSLRLADGRIGHAYVAGRSRRHAELAALFDALLQDPARHERLESDLIAPLEARQRAARERRQRRSAATRVDFFTMVRGEDPA